MSDVISNINNNYIGGDILDGQWVALDQFELFHGDVGAYTSASSVKIISLEDILPNDDFTYLCQIRVYGATGTSSSNMFLSEIVSGSVEYKYTGNNAINYSGLPVTIAQGVRTRTANSRICAGWLFIPVYPEDRHITMINSNQANNSDYPVGVYLLRFRRLGTNR